MRPQKQRSSNMTVLDAVETLTSIVDLDEDFEDRLSLTPEELGLEGEISPTNIEWIHGNDIDATIKRVKGIFNVILEYVEGFYEKGSQYMKSIETIEGIKNIMLLVGEAAKKLDLYTSVYCNAEQGVITRLPEYRKLQKFYQKKVDRKIGENVLSKWVLALTKTAFLQDALLELKGYKIKAIRHAFVEMDEVKLDSEYELLLMRKNNGSTFYNPRLIRNIKLVCDFGGTIGEEEKYDILSKTVYWREEVYYIAAINILNSIQSELHVFYQQAVKNQDHELVLGVSKILMALLMAANPHNQRKRHPIKTNSLYFSDFQMFLREIMSSRRFQRMIIYPPNKRDQLAHSLLDIVEAICRVIFMNLHVLQRFQLRIEDILHEARHQAKTDVQKMGDGLSLWSRLANHYASVLNALRYHSTGPLERDLYLLDQFGISGFDSILQMNWPNFWFDLHCDNEVIHHVRIPSPTRQEWIHLAEITDEFKGFLFECAKLTQRKRILVVNLQDGTDWREHARCRFLEKIQKSSLFDEVLTVVTLPCGTEFYHQMGTYEGLNDAADFKKVFCEQIAKNDSGFYFPDSIRDAFSSQYVSKALDGIHAVFFGHKETLSQEERTDFVSLAYALFELKLIETCHPTAFSLTCKDGIDTGAAATAMLFILNELLNREVLSEASQEYLNLILYGPAFLIRERAMLPVMFDRVMKMTKRMEIVRDKKGFAQFRKEVKDCLEPLFTSNILHSHIEIPRNL